MNKIQDFFPLKIPSSLKLFYDTFIGQRKKPTIYIVATSGGSDSLMVLCSVYQYLFSQQGEGESLRLVVVHCNHKTRKETDHEESLVMQYLDRSVEYRGFRYRQKPSTESDLRTWRWGCFEKVVAEKQHVHPDHTVVVLTGHHLDDNIETSLLNLTRGCGLWGLGNMEEITINMFDHEKKNYTYTIMRPLLHQTKQSIVTWCDMVGLHYVVDETNFDRRGGQRSVIRHFVQGKLSVDPDRYSTWIGLYKDISLYKSKVSQSYVLLPLVLCAHWQLDWGYRWKLTTPRSLLTFDLLISVLHDIGAYRNITTGGLAELVHFLGSGTAGYKILGHTMFVVAHDVIYIFGGDVMVDDAPFWEIKPIAKPRTLDRVGEYRYGPHLFEVTECWVGCTVRYIQAADTYRGKNIKKYLLNQKVPIFLRNSTIVIAKETQILAVITDCDHRLSY